MTRSVLRPVVLAGALALGLAGAANAATTGAPLATTGFPSQLSTTSAILTGTVDPQGSDTTVQFEWGTTTAYGQSTPAVPAVVPALTGAVATGNAKVRSAQIALVAGTTYHFRVVATNAAGTTDGADVTFTAQNGAKPTVVTGPVTLDPSFTRVTLTGTLNPNGQDTTYKFHIALDQAALGTNSPPAAMITPRQPAAPQAPLTGTADIPVTQDYPSTHSQPPLQPGTTYYYRLVATNATGSTLGPILSFFTGTVVPPPPPKQPPAVTTRPAASVTAHGAVLQGLLNPAGQATSFHFEYGTTAAYGLSTPPLAAGAGTAAFPVTTPLSNLQPGVTYHFRIVGTNPAGTSKGADATFTTPPAVASKDGTNPPPGPAARARLRLQRLRAIPSRIRISMPRGCTTSRALATSRCRRAAARLAIRLRFDLSTRSRVRFTVRRGRHGRALVVVYRAARAGANTARLPVLVHGRPLARGLYTISAVAGRGTRASVPVLVRIVVR